MNSLVIASTFSAHRVLSVVYIYLLNPHNGTEVSTLLFLFFQEADTRMLSNFPKSHSIKWYSGDSIPRSSTLEAKL